MQEYSMSILNSNVQVMPASAQGLVVEFANSVQQNEGLSRIEAVKKASSIRLRPVIMTSAATVIGVMPLLLASGPGAVGRFAIGLVIASGLAIGALISLYVVPVVYTYVAADKRSVEADRSLTEKEI